MKIIIRRTNLPEYLHGEYDVIDAAAKQLIGTATGSRGRTGGRYHYTPSDPDLPTISKWSLKDLRRAIIKLHTPATSENT